MSERGLDDRRRALTGPRALRRAGWQLGEHDSWHKFTNFELGTRVPLIMRAPWLTASIGKRTSLFAELIDVSRRTPLLAVEQAARR